MWWRKKYINFACCLNGGYPCEKLLDTRKWNFVKMVIIVSNFLFLFLLLYSKPKKLFILFMFMVFVEILKKI